MLNIEGEGGANVTLGEAARAAREEAITLPLTGDLQMLHLGDLFPTFPGVLGGATQAYSEGGSRPATSEVGAGRAAGLVQGCWLTAKSCLCAAACTALVSPHRLYYITACLALLFPLCSWEIACS